MRAISWTAPRLKRERKTVEAMIRIYCRAHHLNNGELCSDCKALSEYARKRLARCPYQEEKPTCAKCPIHCYRPTMKEKIKDVMRYAGPWMMLHHPYLALRHLLDSKQAGSGLLSSSPDRTSRKGESES